MPPTARSNGQARITQALPPPYGELEFPVSGTVHHTGFATDTLLVALSGQYAVSVPPPAIGTYLAHFMAAPAVDQSWNGTGSYSYDRHQMSRCKVTNTAK
ncbi:MAG: DUF1842 domain-containing protein [Novosphingobium sp.]